MFNLTNLFGKKSEVSKDEIAAFLKTDIKALEMFEEAYNAHNMASGISDNLFKLNSKQVAEINAGVRLDVPNGIDNLIQRIVTELISKTVVYSYHDRKFDVVDLRRLLPANEFVTSLEVMSIPKEFRPSFTGNLMQIDIPGAGLHLLNVLKTSMAQGNAATGFMILHECAYGTPYDVDKHESKFEKFDYNLLQKSYPGANCLHAHAGQMLRNDEIIFYQEEQITAKYLVEIR